MLHLFRLCWEVTIGFKLFGMKTGYDCMNKLEVTLQSTFQCHNSQLTYQQELERISQLWFFSPHLLSEFMELEMLSKFCEHVL